MRFWAEFVNDIGNVRSVNQDSVMIKHIRISDEEVIFAAVCDGVGGLSDGETASAYAAERLSEFFDGNRGLFTGKAGAENIKEHLHELVKQINRELFGYAQRRGITVGTTCTAALFFREYIAAVHVGDTSLYRLTERAVKLTQDHTLGAGKMKHVLWQCVGAAGRTEPQMLILKAEKGTYLLCSDGFCNTFSDEELYSMLHITSEKGAGMKRKLRRAADIAAKRGETDNMSAVLIKVF